MTDDWLTLVSCLADSVIAKGKLLVYAGNPWRGVRAA